jgi:hypothetical protein
MSNLTLQMPDQAGSYSPPPALTAKELVMLKKEAKKAAEEAELTFKPQILNRGRSKRPATAGGGGGDVSRFDRLYSDALKRHMEDKYKEAVTDKELTFKPKLTSRSRSSSRERSAPVVPVRELERQHKTGTGHVKSPPPPPVAPTFKPTISKRANSIERTRGETAANLYAHNKTAKELQNLLKAEAEEKMADSCTFKPQTNVRARPPSRGRGMDLNERMSKFEELKRAKLEAAKRNQLEKEKVAATHTPQTFTQRKPASRSATPTRGQQQVPVHARSNNATALRSQTPDRTRKSYEAELTFQPQIFSKRAPSPNHKANEAANVHERLFSKGQERKKQGEIERELIKQENESHLTFKPVINQYKKRGETDAETTSPVFERLVVKGNTKQIMQNVLGKLKDELELKDCTFKPTLVSADMRRKTDNVQQYDERFVFVRVSPLFLPSSAFSAFGVAP